MTKSFKSLFEDVNCAALLKARIKEKLAQVTSARQALTNVRFSCPDAQARLQSAKEDLDAAAQLEVMHLRKLGKEGRWAGHPDCKGKII